MGIRRVVVPFTADASGDATVYSPPVAGEIMGVSLVKPGSGGFATTADVTVTNETTGQNIWVESNITATAHRAPRQPVHDQTGAAGLYAAAGAAVLVPIALAQSRIKCVVAQGGNLGAGTFHFLVRN